MRIHTTAKIEHDAGLMSFVREATRVIVEEIGRSDRVRIAWETREKGLLAVWIVDHLDLFPAMSIEGIAGGDFAGLRARIRRHVRSTTLGSA